MAKLPILILVWLSLAGLLAAQAAFADAAADLKQAEALYKAGRYAEAEQPYLRAIQAADSNDPTQWQRVVDARAKLTVVYIATGRMPQAQAMMQELLAKHSTYERLPHALHEIIEQAKGLNKTTQAGQVYRDVLTAQPGHSQAIWLKMGIAIADTYLGNDQAAQADLRDIIARHSTSPWAGEALAQVGWAYDKLDEYAKARPLYEYVVANWSDKPRAMYAHTALVGDCIRLRDRQAARTHLEQLARRYAADTQLPSVLTEIARGYREAQMYEEARRLAENVLRSYAGHEQCLWAQRDIILCDIAQRDQNTAQAGLQKLVSSYANHGYFPYVLNEIAEGYRRGQMHPQAKSVSQYVLDHLADSDQCLWAQRDIVLTDLASKNVDAANAGIQILQSRFAKQPGAIWAISEVAEACAELGRHEQARDLFRFNLNNCPDLDDTIWSLREFVRESITLRDQAGVDAGIKKLFSDYSASKNLPMAAVHIGMDLYKASHPQAGELFQYVIDKHSDHEQAVLAKGCMGHVFLQQGQDGRAEAIFQRLLTDYANSPRLAEVVRLVGEGYYQRATVRLAEARKAVPSEPNQPKANVALPESAVQDHQKVIQVLETVIRKLPPNAIDTPIACHMAGESYQQIGQPQKAIECYQRVCDNWPAYAYAWHLQYLIGRTYEGLKEAGTIAPSDADPKIKAAYENLVAKYPACPAAKPARSRLARLAQSQQGGDQ